MFFATMVSIQRRNSEPSFDGGFFIFNDTDAGRDTELGVMKILNGSNPSGQTATTDAGSDDFEIFPNPNNGHFRVSGLSPNKHTEVQVFDAQGKLVYSKTIIAPSILIDLSGLVIGPCFVRIAPDGHSASCCTVIIE